MPTARSCLNMTQKKLTRYQFRELERKVERKRQEIRDAAQQCDGFDEIDTYFLLHQMNCEKKMRYSRSKGLGIYNAVGGDTGDYAMQRGRLISGCAVHFAFIGA